MEAKQIQWIITGMQRDVSVSKFSPKHAYECFNIRLTAREDGTLLSVTNEKGNKARTITGLTNSLIAGTYLGHAIINNILVIFTLDGSTSKIFKIIYNEVTDTFTGELFYSGNLGFNIQYPIETVVLYENENIQKVYWTDGLNQPRVINIAATDKSNFSPTYFDFVPTISLNESVTVTRNLVASGVFSPGVIQYAFTYFNMYGQESNIFYTTPLNYISYNNRGASPEDQVSNSFNITLLNVDTKFDYLRIYSIHRTSIDATPTVLNVADIAINSDTLTYLDNGTKGFSVDPAVLLFIGGESLVVGTMAHKDNTLFLGNIKLTREVIPDTVRSVINNGSPTFNYSSYKIDSTPLNVSSYYPYQNQLIWDSYKIKTFKYLEYYRLGVQFQHTTGKWSEVVWVNDLYNDLQPKPANIPEEVGGIGGGLIPPLVEGRYTLSDSTAISTLVSKGYVRMRGVVCYPTIAEREAVAQGILAPTVFNVSDRYTNSPFVQSSWFARPNAPFDQARSLANGGDWLSWGGQSTPVGWKDIYSKAGMWSNDTSTVDGKTMDLVGSGAWTEFRHHYPIPGNDKRNAEIQCLVFPLINPYFPGDLDEAGIQTQVQTLREYFYIDQSILTFHSPDIEFDDRVKSLDTSSLKLRIVGMVPITGTVSDLDIITSTPQNAFNTTSTNPGTPQGLYKETVGSRNISRLGWKGLVSGGFWFDEVSKYKAGVSNASKNTTAFVVYPWHRNGSLNNYPVPTSEENRSAMLDKKKLSNLRFSINSFYYEDTSIWKAQDSNNPSVNTGISGVSIFDSDQITMVKIPKPLNSNLEDLVYYGNIDKVLNITRISKSYLISDNGVANIINFSRTTGYPIMTTGSPSVAQDPHSLFIQNYAQVSSTLTDFNRGTEPVRMKYKSTPHAIVALNYTTDGKQRILPTIRGTVNNVNYTVNPINNPGNGCKPFWKGGVGQISQDVLLSSAISANNSHNTIGYGFFWLAELYNDSVSQRFGGQTQEAFENNLWFPAGEPVSLLNGTSPKTSVEIKYLEGDTFYQRYDHLKTYPFTLEDQNSVTDIVSFMCETRINLDGRYDRNRAQVSNLTVTPINFNKLNPVYSQTNNFFPYRALNYNRFSLNKFPNTVTWTKSKALGELNDTWTNITMASVLDLDGDKGRINALRRFNNDIFAFQDTGIAQVLFNSRVQIPTSEGVPIEIANSYKVDGKRYLSEQMGCINKWSIRSTPKGLYFIDNKSTSIQLLSGQGIANVSDDFGFRTFLQDNESVESWNPYTFSNFINFYDKNNNDVYFINKDYCLGFSELLQQFTSFYSYEEVPLMFNLGNKFFSLKNNKLWEQGAGHYNLFFGEIKPFHVTLIANPDEPEDKIFSTVNYRADTFGENGLLPNVTFDTFSIWNEYQTGVVNLINQPGYTSPLKRKFRSWNITVPRDEANKRDRIRNPWAFIKLEMRNPSIYKTVLHDVIMNYFI